MANFPELEIGLYREETDRYTVELRFRRPDDAAQRQPIRGQAQIDTAALRAQLLEPAVYGRTLSDGLLADPIIRKAFDAARAATQSLDQPLRVRLLVGQSAPELHNLRWETLRDPENGGWLLTSENVLFSRFLGSSDWRPIKLRPKADLRALVVIANPADLAGGRFRVRGHDLAPVKVDDELARAQRGLGDLFAGQLISDPAAPGQASIQAITAALRDRYDILYLVCHGGILSKEPAGPYLWLEKEDGTADVVPGQTLVDYLSDLPPRDRPMLVVLASCESAGTGGTPSSADEGALAALGPRLAEAGIPAVLAMQDSVSMDTVAGFMPVFFEQLRDHGQLDQALAAARGVVRDHDDAWMPVLFMRLSGGAIWFQPGFAGDQPEFEQWDSLISSIRDEKCTPILGPGLIDFVFGSSRDLARRWAEKAVIPAALVNTDSLPQVAQYLATYQSPHFPHSQLKRHLETQIRARYALPDDLQYAELDELLTNVGTLRRQQDNQDPFYILSQLPVSVYINTNPDTLLFEALTATNGKQPKEASFIWKDYLRELELLPVFSRDDRFRPSVREPMVYYLMGHVREPDSWVVSEDDHFDYLMRVDDDAETDIPSFVDRALSENSLLFLGFHIDDWNFRVLFRSIMNEDRRYRRRYHQSVAVQIDPSEGSQQPERVRRYLEKYFGERISVYWGSAEDFLKELWQRWQRDGGGL
ncbi:MAG: CHAT domain-containing protein [Anaerolineae bacterium]|nr:CHAT domain-containing protein [Anaerolineae bacterium]